MRGVEHSFSAWVVGHDLISSPRRCVYVLKRRAVERLQLSSGVPPVGVVVVAPACPSTGGVYNDLCPNPMFQVQNPLSLLACSNSEH